MRVVHYSGRQGFMNNLLTTPLPCRKRLLPCGWVRVKTSTYMFRKQGSFPFHYTVGYILVSRVLFTICAASLIPIQLAQTRIPHRTTYGNKCLTLYNLHTLIHDYIIFTCLIGEWMRLRAFCECRNNSDNDTLTGIT